MFHLDTQFNYLLSVDSLDYFVLQLQYFQTNALFLCCRMFANNVMLSLRLKQGVNLKCLVKHRKSESDAFDIMKELFDDNCMCSKITKGKQGLWGLEKRKR